MISKKQFCVRLLETENAEKRVQDEKLKLASMKQNLASTLSTYIFFF